eukprot:TRINITY_DN20743_c0_g1_i1.p1 TRINITY_DN20743_c0_g1~~TRINITY_DN20743_c0_g1_i1.p1  ORF type:complete len:142 (-),score=49.93 TRINITY_DN20743_c0_g1_i1:44-415(-)
MCIRDRCDVKAGTKATWDKVREVLLEIGWRKLDSEEADKRLNQFFYEANKLRNMGKEKEARELLFRTLRVQNKIIRDEMNPGQLTQSSSHIKKGQMKKSRNDFFDFSTFKFRGTSTLSGREEL